MGIFTGYKKTIFVTSRKRSWFTGVFFLHLLSALNTKIGNYPDSDEEIVVGSFCGKPLYRKRLMNGEAVSNGIFTLNGAEFSIELLVRGYGCIKTVQEDIFPVNFSDGNHNESNVYLGADKNVYVIEKRAGTFNGFYGWIYIEYTKTTD